MTLHELMADKGLLRKDGSIESYGRINYCDDIFKVITDYLHCSIFNGLDFCQTEGISSLLCDFDDKYCEDLFCVFIRGVCNAIHPVYISYLIDCYLEKIYKILDDSFLDRIMMLSYLLKRILFSFSCDDQIECLSDIISLTSMSTSSDMSWYCYSKLNETIIFLRRKE